MTFDPQFATEELVNQRSEAAARSGPPAELHRRLRPARPAAAHRSPLATSTVPALIVHGRDDRVVHFENSLSLVSVIPNSRLVLLNRCGHWAQVEHPAEFNRLVADFVGTGA